MDIDVVIIGLNASQTLADCIESVQRSEYDAGAIRIVYVDSGSSDQSCEIAEQLGAVALSVNREHPSPGSGRNAGWRHGSAPLVQFLDSDTIVDKWWLQNAVNALGEGVAAVRGNRIEAKPDASYYNWIADQEWNAEPGECADFGGDVLIRREYLETTGGYDDELVGGEDPDLSLRVRQQGGTIVQLDETMTIHDIDTYQLKPHFKRAIRTGYAFAAVSDRHQGLATADYWRKECKRVAVRGGGAVGIFLLGALSFLIAWWLPFLIVPVSIALLLFPRILRVGYFMADKSLDRKDATRYSWNCSLIVLPQLWGMLRYYYGKLTGNPLRNQRVKVAFIIVGTFMLGGCQSAGFHKGINDFSEPDSFGSRKDHRVAETFEVEDEDSDHSFATADELKQFSASVPDTYFIGPGDIMTVEVRGRPEISVKEATVSPDGKLSLPQAGIIPVKGESIETLTSEITRRLSKYYDDPEVAVLMHEFKNNKVFVLGRVASPGLVNFDGAGTLLEALALSGGLPTEAADSYLSRAMIFRGNDMVVWVDLRELLQNGNIAMNPRLRNNDLVFVPDSDDQLVYVMGEVESPGAVNLKNELTVLDAIMASGGPTKDSRTMKTYLIRYEGGADHVQPINLNRFFKRGDLRQDYRLRDGDIIYVTPRPIAEVNYAINQLSPVISYVSLAALLN
ncbi:MAG: polysaccharide biosynthesis/export family protein [Verrucomicrobiota bacterium]